MDFSLSLFFGFAGACIGSFLNVLSYRYPREIKIYSPLFSFCPHCQKKISPLENIPIFSWLFLRGKCRKCKNKIPFADFITELLCFLYFFLIPFLYPFSETLSLLFLFSLLISISRIDIHFYIVPLPFIFIGILFFFSQKLFLEESIWIASFHFLFGFLLLSTIRFLGNFFIPKRKLWDGEFEWKILGKDNKYFLSLLSSKTGEEILLPEKGEGRIEINQKMIFFQEFFFCNKKRQSYEKSLPFGKGNSVYFKPVSLGSGDPYVLGLITLFLGFQSAFWVLFSSAFLGIFWFFLTKRKKSAPLPYVPFLFLGSVTWTLGGNKLWDLYFKFLGF